MCCMDLSIGFGQLCKDQDFSLRGVLVLLYGYHTLTDFSIHIVYAVCDTQFTGRLNNDSKENRG